jgi:YHS domain-containing protein
MQRVFLYVSGTLSIAAALFAGGCSSSNTANKAATSREKSEVATTEAPDSATAKPAQNGIEAEITNAISKLSPEDRALALKQKVCPVSGEALGSMGTPLKMNVKGQTVFLCCEGCKDRLLASPDEYLAKIKE